MNKQEIEKALSWFEPELNSQESAYAFAIANGQDTDKCFKDWLGYMRTAVECMEQQLTGGMRMQREIKLRGKRVDNGEWIYGCLITGFFLRGGKDIPYIMTTDGADYDCFEDIQEGNGIFEVIAETVGQYTGLKDKNGNEIYEGDIVEYKDFSNGMYLFKEQPKAREVIKINNLLSGIYLKGMGTFEESKVEVSE